MRVGRQVRTSVKHGDAVSRQREVFERYHLGQEVENIYPFQLSGNGKRTLLSTAMISEAKVIIADEPTPGLDPAVMKEALITLGSLLTMDVQSC